MPSDDLFDELFAAAVRDFYQRVVGWSSSDVEMGGYQDYCMIPAAGDAPAAGICHARGANAAFPPQWMVYINVADLDRSVAACTSGGGVVVVPPNAPPGKARYAVIRDPAGAVCALFQPAPPPPPPSS